jgi:positive regulator of sigma E activity
VQPDHSAPQAAHHTARAAGIQRTVATATVTAQSTASSALSAAGVRCASMAEATATDGKRHDGTVNVTVTGAVDRGDALNLGVPDQKRLSATAIEPIDTQRATVTAAGGGS